MTTEEIRQQAYKKTMEEYGYVTFLPRPLLKNKKRRKKSSTTTEEKVQGQQPIEVAPNQLNLFYETQIIPQRTQITQTQ